MSHTTRIPTPVVLSLFALLAVAALLFAGAASGALAGAQPALQSVTVADQALVYGGGCTSSCNDDEDDDDSSGGGSSPYAVGSAYWSQTGSTLLSRDSTAARLADEFNNWASYDVRRSFSYTHRLVRSVEFTGGWANYFSASIGGEVNRTTSRSTTYSVPPMTKAKLYTRDVTRRSVVEGTKYQDYSDGSRRVVATDSGPYARTRTVTGFVTRSLP